MSEEVIYDHGRPKCPVCGHADFETFLAPDGGVSGRSVDHVECALQLANDLRWRTEQRDDLLRELDEREGALNICRRERNRLKGAERALARVMTDNTANYDRAEKAERQAHQLADMLNEEIPRRTKAEAEVERLRDENQRWRMEAVKLFLRFGYSPTQIADLARRLEER